MGDVTVITPSLPERGRLLERARASVADQDHLPTAHLIGGDYAGHGPARVRNRLAAVADTEWLAFLDDDDHLDPRHLRVLLAHSDGADVVYPDCRFDGPPLPDAHLPRPFDRAYLAERGYFAITLLVRRAAFDFAGGFPEGARYEDWALWNAMANRGFTFRYVPDKTWTYCTGHPGRRTNK